MTDNATPRQILDILDDAESRKAQALLKEAAQAEREYQLDTALMDDLHPVWQEEHKARTDGLNPDLLIDYLNRLHTSMMTSLIGWTWIAKQVGIGRLELRESTVGDRTVENRIILRDVDRLVDPGPLVYNTPKKLLLWIVAESGLADEDDTFLPEDIEAAAITKQLAFRCTACEFVLPGEPASTAPRSEPDGLPNYVLCESCLDEEKRIEEEVTE